MDKYTFTPATQDDAFGILDFYHSLIGTPGCTWNLDYPDEEIVNQDIFNKSLYLLKEDNEIVSASGQAFGEMAMNLAYPKGKEPVDFQSTNEYKELFKQRVQSQFDKLGYSIR